MLRDIGVIGCVIAGLLFGSQIPVMMAIYEQQLDSVRQDLFSQLSAFRTNAEQNNLSLQDYLARLSSSDDAQIRGSGTTLARLVQRLTYLEQHAASLRADTHLYLKLFRVLRDGEAEMVGQALAKHRFMPLLSLHFGVPGGAAGYGVFRLLRWLVRFVTGRRVRRLQKRRYR